MAKGLNIIEALRGADYKRGDTRQAAREQEKLETALAGVLHEISDDIFRDGYVFRASRYAARWRLFANKWNQDKKTVCYVYPEYIADYLLSQEVGEECQPYKINNPFTI